MHLVSFAAVFKVIMRQVLCDNPNNGCEGEKVLTTWERLNCKKSSQQLIAIVCHRYDRLAALQNVFAIILHWASKDV